MIPSCSAARVWLPSLRSSASRISSLSKRRDGALEVDAAGAHLVAQRLGAARDLHFLGQVGERRSTSPSQSVDGALDRVLELAHVAGPGVALERAQRLGLEAPRPATRLVARAREEGLGEQPDVLAALAQRRQRDRHDVDAVEEIGAEAALRRPRARGRGWSRRRRARRRRSAASSRAARSSRSWSARSSFACTAGASSPISSRKSVPPWAASKRPMRRSRASVKAPFSWPKSSLSISVAGIAAQFTDDEALVARGPRSWIARATSSLPVPLSPVISTFARDVRDALDRAEDGAHRLALPDQATEPRASGHLVAQPHDFLLERAALEELAHLDAQRVDLEGLGHEVGGAELHRLDGGRDGARRREHDHRRRVVALGELAQEVEAGAAGHHEVEQHGVGGALVEQRERRVDVARRASRRTRP